MSTRSLKLTTCRATEFTCDDGTCIPMEKRCDQKQDCGAGEFGYVMERKMAALTAVRDFFLFSPGRRK